MFATLFKERFKICDKVHLSMRVAIYARVSTKDKGQDTENQLHQLRAFAEQHGPIYRVFTDQKSGGKAGVF